MPELYFATVRAIGTPVAPTVDALEDSLKRYRYRLQTIYLSRRLEHLGFPSGDVPSGFERYRVLNDVGTDLRQGTRRNDAVLLEAVRYLHESRRAEEKAKARAHQPQRRGIAYLFRNLMHPKEAERLRKLYGSQLFVLSLFRPNGPRRDHLERQFGKGRGKHSHNAETLAAELVAQEEGWGSDLALDRAQSERRKYASNIPSTFEHGDLFLDYFDPEASQRQIDRLVALIFGEPFATQTEDEVGMADAFAAALQSGNLARRVGAAICTSDGELLATGTNDVPRPGGGVYRSSDLEDNRDYNTDPRRGELRGYDSSDTSRYEAAKDFMQRLISDPAWLLHLANNGGDQAVAPAVTALHDYLLALSPAEIPDVVDIDALLTTIIRSEHLWRSQFFDIIEYGRTMHAEMDAITSAARKGVS